jgi:hypothetical protein
MTSLLRKLVLLLVVAALAVPASAAEILRQVPAALDPAKAYVLVEIRNHDGSRLPGAIVLARYDPAGEDVRGGARSPASGLTGPQDVRIAIARRALARTRESRLYLVALEPDTWVIEGAGGTAFSLGSWSFTVAAGEVVDLGVLSPATDWPEGESAPRLTAGRLATLALLGPFARSPEQRPAMLEMRARTAADLAVPAQLRAALVPVSLQSGATFGNYLGGLVNRIDGRRGRPGTTSAEVAPAEASAAPPPSDPAPPTENPS